jgi:CRISPR-associated protein Cmr2
VKGKTCLHFSLGPVQGFVAQARRTRDFWAGSFILSYLAGQAMLAVIEAGGELVLPAVKDEMGQITDPLLSAIQQRREGIPVSGGPEIATLPNRFQAEVSDDFDPSVCVEAVKEAWTDLAEKVWQAYLQPVAHLGQSTREIWERQINGFWEMVWVMGDDPALLDRRKNWRTHVPPVEPGDKCTLMGNMQELSGYLRMREKERQDNFWEALRRRVGALNLAETERLCAVALVKRLFPLVAEEILWRVPRRYPSTPYLAAVPWLAQVCRNRPEEARRYAVKAASLTGVSRCENPERFACLKGVLASFPETREFASLDGNCFFDSSLANPNLWKQGTEQAVNISDLRRELKKHLAELGPPAAPFYAMLVMDGDRLGALLREYLPEKISAALRNFSQSVKRIIQDNNGVTVFAGGDDVLALLPVDGALPAAIGLHAAYLQSFAGVGAGKGTISGAIVYAHFTTPLTAVYREAHRLLDDVAKEETGRDSLAVAVWKGAGRVLTWSAPWEVVTDGRTSIFVDLVEAFQGNDSRQKEFNSTFFYNLRARFDILQEKGALELSEEDMVDILAAEYLKNRERQCTPDEARERVKKLLTICRRSWRDEEGIVHKAEGALTLDGALLVKFLAGRGVV